MVPTYKFSDECIKIYKWLCIIVASYIDPGLELRLGYALSGLKTIHGRILSTDMSTDVNTEIAPKLE